MGLQEVLEKSEMYHYEALRRFIRPLRRSLKRFWGSLRSTRGSNSGFGGPRVLGKGNAGH